MDHPEDCVLAIESTFECSLCRGIFTSHSKLQFHKCHIPKKRKHYLCELCGYFVQPDRMQTHYQQVHQIYIEFDCCACKSSFGTEQDLVVHQNTVHYDGKSSFSKKYKCQICKIGFSRKDAVKRHHLNMHERKNDVPCDVCKQSFPNRHDMLVHLRSAHRARREFECADCGKNLPTRKSLCQHRSRVHEKKLLVCSVCDIVFRTRRDELHHWRTVHEAQKPTQTPTFKHEDSFVTEHDQVHENTAHCDGKSCNNKRYKCGMCGERFTRGHDMRLHELLLHGRRKEFACEDCERSYSKRYQLATHRRNFHGGQKDYCCSICKRGFSRKQSMQRHHVRMHEGKEDVFCDLCRTSFSNRYDMLLHRRSAHYVRKEYECADCGTKFPTKINLRQHIIAHEKQRLVCDICKTEFATKRNIRCHLRIVHTGGKLFQCETCQNNFSSKSNLKRHESNAHQS